MPPCLVAASSDGQRHVERHLSQAVVGLSDHPPRRGMDDLRDYTGADALLLVGLQIVEQVRDAHCTVPRLFCGHCGCGEESAALWSAPAVRAACAQSAVRSVALMVMVTGVVCTRADLTG